MYLVLWNRPSTKTTEYHVLCYNNSNLVPGIPSVIKLFLLFLRQLRDLFILNTGGQQCIYYVCRKYLDTVVRVLCNISCLLLGRESALFKDVGGTCGWETFSSCRVTRLFLPISCCSSHRTRTIFAIYRPQTLTVRAVSNRGRFL